MACIFPLIRQSALQFEKRKHKNYVTSKNYHAVFSIHDSDCPQHIYFRMIQSSSGVLLTVQLHDSFKALKLLMMAGHNQLPHNAPEHKDKLIALK